MANVLGPPEREVPHLRKTCSVVPLELLEGPWPIILGLVVYRESARDDRILNTKICRTPGRYGTQPKIFDIVDIEKILETGPIGLKSPNTTLTL